MSEQEKPLSKMIREFTFTLDDFKRVRTLLYDHAGISLSDSKQELVYSRLSRRLRSTGIPTFAEYIRLLETAPEEEWEAFINAMTTNLTSFFAKRITYLFWQSTCNCSIRKARTR